MEILEKGKFYYPASKHYQEDANVVCNSCGKENLVACIGYGNKDLCLACSNLMLIRQEETPYVIPAPPIAMSNRRSGARQRDEPELPKRLPEKAHKQIPAFERYKYNVMKIQQETEPY